jgi:hypothetical protein
MRGYRTYPNITVSAGEIVALNITGRYLMVYQANQSLFEIKFDGGGTFGECFSGFEVDLEGDEPFKRVEIRNPNGSDLTVSIGVSNGEIRDRRLQLVGSGLDLSKAANLADVADVTLPAATATLISAANADRRAIAITNKTGGEIRIGASTVDAARGLALASNATATLSVTAAIYGYSAGGGDVAVLETED